MKKIEDSFEGRVVRGRVEWNGGKSPPDGSRVKVRLNGPSKVRNRTKRIGPAARIQSSRSRKKGHDDLEKLYQNLLSLAGVAKN